MPSANLTIRDVAKRAGVSHQTISRVINGAPPATAETRAIAEAAIDRVLAAGRGQTLACLAPNLTARIIEGTGAGEALTTSPTGHTDHSPVRMKKIKVGGGFPASS